MLSETTHVTPYRTYMVVLITLLVLTSLTITVTWIDLSAFTVLSALLIASFKAGIVMKYFMHLKFESSLFKILVIMVLSIYILVIILLFFDYLFR